jgi:C4-type Zn-finger protein
MRYKWLNNTLYNLAYRVTLRPVTARVFTAMRAITMSDYPTCPSCGRKLSISNSIFPMAERVVKLTSIQCSGCSVNTAKIHAKDTPLYFAYGVKV